jgi:hypothetical protein
LKKILFQPKDPITLSFFRIIFGICFLWESLYLLKINFVSVFLTSPQVHFNYDFATFIQPLPKSLLSILVIGLLVASIFMIIGKYLKAASWYIFFVFSYILLIDKAYYNNHLYLICLLAAFFAITSSDEALSIKKDATKHIPNWQLILFQLQLVIVYFFGGIAKINSDWLIRMEPVKTILEQKAANSALSSLLQSEIAVYFISYGGLAFDLLIGFLLFYKPTRKIALIAALVFNIMNAWLFNDINIFPFMMMGALVLFINPEEFRSFLTKYIPTLKSVQSAAKDTFAVNQKVIIGLAIYFIFQVSVPLRHLLFEGNTEWTGKAQYFSWRMKIQTRKTEQLEFAVMNYDKKEVINVDLRSFGLNDDQLRLLSMHPETGVQLAKAIRETAEKKGLRNIEVKAKVKVSFNGRPAQMLYEDMDLSKVKEGIFEERDYVVDLKE